MLLKKSLLGNQPYHHIDEFGRNRDGRGAWLALKAYYKGEDFVNRTTQECLTKLRTLHYRGETPRFGFEQFVEAQKECYKRLCHVGYNGRNGVDEASKCTNLKSMIISDAQLETTREEDEGEAVVLCGRKPRTYLTKIVQGREIHNRNCPAAAFAELTREQKDAVEELRHRGEELASDNQSDNASIKLMITEAVNARLKEVVINGVANATINNTN